MSEQQTTVTLEDGRVFPVFNGEALSWSTGMYSSWSEQRSGYPRMRAVVRAMAQHRPAELQRERRELLKASFDRMFGMNAKRELDVIDRELVAWVSEG